MQANPLRELATIKWLKNQKKTGNPDYMNLLKEKRRMLELEELFNKFDDDKSGTLDMAELYHMFKQAGIEISQKDLRTLF